MKVATYTKENRRLEIHLGESFESPREWDNLSKFVFTNGLNETDFRFEGGYESRQDFIEKGEAEIRKAFKDVAVCLAVHKYEHGGVSYSTDYGYPHNCRWDSGTIGFIIITKQDIRVNWMIKRATQKYIDWAEKIAISELKTYSQWANGEVYRFELYEDDELIDCCGGFYGDNIKENGILENVGNEWAEIEED